MEKEHEARPPGGSGTIVRSDEGGWGQYPHTVKLKVSGFRVASAVVRSVIAALTEPRLTTT